MSQKENDNIVKIGMAIGLLLNIVLYLGAYYLVPLFENEMTLAERIALGFKCLLFPGLFLLVTILRVGSQRYGNSSENPTVVTANTEGMKIDLCVLANTNEQLLVFTINTLGLAVLLPLQYLTLLPIYSGLFVVGRILFWLGYRYHILWRAPGFAMAVFPAVAGLSYCCLKVLTGLFT